MNISTSGSPFSPQKIISRPISPFPQKTEQGHSDVYFGTGGAKRGKINDTEYLSQHRDKIIKFLLTVDPDGKRACDVSSPDNLLRKLKDENAALNRLTITHINKLLKEIRKSDNNIKLKDSSSNSTNPFNNHASNNNSVNFPNDSSKIMSKKDKRRKKKIEVQTTTSNHSQ